MGIVVPLVTQEGNKYILTLIMKAIVAYALAAFAAIAVNSIEATPLTYNYDPYAYAVLTRATRHAHEPVEFLEYENDYGAALAYEYGVAPAKHDIYSYAGQYRLTKRGSPVDLFAPTEFAPQQGCFHGI